MKRFIPTVSQKSAEGKVGHAVGKDMEALQGRKAEQPIGRAGNDDRRPERYPARGIKGKASEQRDLRDDRRQKKPILLGLAEASRGEAPRGIQEGTESPSGDALCRKPGYFTPSSTRRTAVCGPACTVVWEGRTGDCPPYPDWSRLASGSSLLMPSPPPRYPAADVRAIFFILRTEYLSQVRFLVEQNEQSCAQHHGARPRDRDPVRPPEDYP